MFRIYDQAQTQRKTELFQAWKHLDVGMEALTDGMREITQ